MQKRADQLKQGDVLVSRLGRKATVINVQVNHLYVDVVAHHKRPDGTLAELEYRPRTHHTVEVEE